jgi:hypothetical protein
VLLPSPVSNAIAEMTNVKNLKRSPAPRVSLASPLLSNNAYHFPKEERKLVEDMTRILANVFPAKISDTEVITMMGQDRETFFKIDKAERKKMIIEEREKMLTELGKPSLGHLRGNVCLGLNEALRHFERGRLCLLVLDRSIKGKSNSGATALDATLAVVKSADGCPVIAVADLGSEVCQKAVGFSASAVGFKTSNAEELKCITDLALRVKLASCRGGDGKGAEEIKSEKASREKEKEKETQENDEDSPVAEPQVKNLLLKRTDSATRVFRPKVISKQRKDDFGTNFISLGDEAKKVQSKKRKAESMQYKKAKMAKAPSGRK